MGQLVEVGNEVLEFPDDMPDAQIAAIIKNQTGKSSFLTGLGETLTGGEQLAGKAAEYISSMGGLAPNEVSQKLSKVNEDLRLRQLKEEEALATSRALSGETGIDWSRLGGNLIGGLPGGIGAEKAAIKLGLTNPAAQAAVVGGATSLTTPTSNENYWETKAKDAAMGTVFGPLGQKSIEYSSRLLNPLIDASEKKLRDLGVTPTIGQTLGGLARSAEEFLQMLPVVGEKINKAKDDVYDQYRNGIINKGLSKVGETLPKGVSGYDAIKHAIKIKDDKYTDALDGTSFTLDNAALTKLSNSFISPVFDKPDTKQVYDSIVSREIMGRFTNGTKVDGEVFKNMESALNQTIYKYKKGDVNEQQIAEALQATLNDVKSVFRRQNPTKASELRKVDSLYRDLTLIEDASKRSETGKFTPENYNMAVKENATARKKRDFGRGTSYGQDIASAGVEVLGDTKQNLTRQIATASLGGYGAYLTDPITASLFGILAPVAYTKGGRKVIDTVLTQRPEMVKKAGEIMKEASAKGGGLFGPDFLRQYNIEQRKNEQK